MSNIPTAEEFLKNYTPTTDDKYDWYSPEVAQEAMIEFAKLHTKAALEKASEDAFISWIPRPEQRTSSMGDFGDDIPIIYKQSILDAYPDENVK